MKTATFSTGETMICDSHTRDYQFAWAIIQNGKIVQKGGFSCDRQIAENAGRLHLGRCNGDYYKSTRSPWEKKYAASVAGKAKIAERAAQWAGAVVEVVPAVG